MGSNSFRSANESQKSATPERFDASASYRFDPEGPTGTGTIGMISAKGFANPALRVLT